MAAIEAIRTANDNEAGPSLTNKRGSKTSLSRKAVPPVEAQTRILPVDDDAQQPGLAGYAYTCMSLLFFLQFSLTMV